MKANRSRSPIFYSPDVTYHADTCEPLRQAVAREETRLVALCRRGYPGHPLPPQMLPEVSTVGFWDAANEQAWGLDWHRNEGIELSFMARGKTEFLVDDKAYLLESGHLTITRPWQQHRVGNPHISASRLHWLILDVGVRRPDQTWKWPKWLIMAPDDLQRLTTLLSQNEQPVWRANAAIGECFEKIAAVVDTREPLAVHTRLQLRINELFVTVLELLQEKKVVLDARLTTRRRTVEMFLADLPQHLEKPWTLGEMAGRCGLHRSRFAGYCQEITNLTPTEYLVRCRVEAAKIILRTKPELSITDIAFDCGFQSSQYFATVFHQQTGQSPSDYRRARTSTQSTKS